MFVIVCSYLPSSNYYDGLIIIYVQMEIYSNIHSFYGYYEGAEDYFSHERAGSGRLSPLIDKRPVTKGSGYARL